MNRLYDHENNIVKLCITIFGNFCGTMFWNILYINNILELFVLQISFYIPVTLLNVLPTAMKVAICDVFIEKIAGYYALSVKCQNLFGVMFN